MKEQGKESEQEFWDGHSFQDNCEWTPDSRFNLTNRVHEIYSDFKRDMRGIKELHRLTELIKKRQASSVQRLGNGEIFDPKEYPQGTFVRLSKDYQENDMSMHWGGEIKTHNLYGVALEQTIRGYNYDVLVCYEIQQAQEGSLGCGPNRVFYGPVKVGEVNHYRQEKVKDPLNDAVKSNRFQSLERVGFIEVLQYGTRLRKRQPVPSTSTQNTTLHVI